MKLPTLQNACKSGIMLACAGLFLSFVQQSNAAVVSDVLISLSSAGAWAPVSTTHSYVWDFHWNGDSNTDANGVANYSFARAGFQLSSNSVTDTLVQIRFSLFDASGHSWNSSLVKADIGGAADYFTFGPVSPLAAGDYWFTLSSSVADANPFQVKLGSISMADGADAMTGNYTTSGNSTGTSAIPETSSSILAAVGVLGMLSFRRRNAAA